MICRPTRACAPQLVSALGPPPVRWPSSGGGGHLGRWTPLKEASGPGRMNHESCGKDHHGGMGGGDPPAAGIVNVMATKISLFISAVFNTGVNAPKHQTTPGQTLVNKKQGPKLRIQGFKTRQAIGETNICRSLRASGRRCATRPNEQSVGIGEPQVGSKWGSRKTTPLRFFPYATRVFSSIYIF